MQNEKLNSIGFVISRHVTNELTSNYWIESYKCIRQYYPTTQIIIIDNGSDYTYITQPTDIEITNCEIIQSEYPNGGLLTPYYYFNKYKWFHRAIILHDSVFVNTYMSFNDIETVAFQWHFDDHRWDDYQTEQFLLNKLTNNTDLLRLYNLKNQWNGCFGVMTIITHPFLNKINLKYSLFSLLQYVSSTQIHGVAIERIFGVLFTIEEPKLISSPSLFGKHDSVIPPGYSYVEYIKDKMNGKFTNTEIYKMIKIYTSRA
jgi:hypothetical protein